MDVPTTEKQSVDQKLIADCERELNSIPSTDILILITGDGDYKNLVRQWQAKGKKVIIFANSNNASQKLLSVADEYYFVDKKLSELLEVKTRLIQMA
ncbi:MAG: NYN domain-containing protein [Okeania sp. SIO2G4]|uniref:NYN domain-containing protein n=1 Tax=unclassified Okeania TaxID=2634635 RepID=UPI0013BA868B|nr:NYN domain-containing protein [Okeania sp. SIO2H7]NEP74549.1 NYN domain-containing protein [Okeania sp. SIO2G5]NEP95608.1 NYN domain-containing protein [Okeania sp. SIO2F5]NEQ92657.1 NYN domain-containing protein [Okeania sp. SIO2G4]